MSRDRFSKQHKIPAVRQQQVILHIRIGSTALSACLSVTYPKRFFHEKPITTTTLDALCFILECDVQDILCYKPDEPEDE